jgi:hypothetical protein
VPGFLRIAATEGMMVDIPELVIRATQPYFAYVGWVQGERVRQLRGRDIFFHSALQRVGKFEWLSFGFQ